MNNNIYPCLWFDGKAKEAADFYCSVFGDSVIKSENHIVVIFESYGQKFMCLNGGPQHKINSSISFYVVCESEKEATDTWKNLLNDGSVLMPFDNYRWSDNYGWLQDKYGVNWQISYSKANDIKQKITPALMFTGKMNGRAEEAISFYTSVFEGSSIKLISRYDKGVNIVDGAIQHAQFMLGNQLFMAMDSSLDHKVAFNEAVSFVVDCEKQEEIDYYWDKLTKGGTEDRCGWLKDKFGVSWQIIPAILESLMTDTSRAEQVTRVFLQMKKFDIEKLISA